MAQVKGETRARSAGGSKAVTRDGRIPVAILGATGAVGQRFVSLLDGHPWFRVTALAASERSAGKPYGEVVRWFLDRPMPGWARDLEVVECRPGLEARVAFSGLDSSVAGEIEEAFAAAGHAVVSNSRNHRMVADVPLLVPEVNADHLDLIAAQRRRRKGDGFIVTNPNCSTVGLVMAAAPIDREFGITRLMTATLQAISGAGYPGVPSVDILDNVIPHIGGEEEKMETETLKILGSASKPAAFVVSAQCHRVQVSDGHTLAVSLATRDRISPEAATRAWRSFRSPLAALGLPSLPEKPVEVRDEPDRPQPRFDRMAGKGMTVTVGRVRRCPVLDLKFTALVHNTIRGAAGVAILNAELLRAKGYL
ncbi:MAG TPA: aspartate-semialdehyde dehydrogenase [Candidatus Polarisedimenticolia bacterium]|nr:aspartate-semialdehyde dehydrogenase [Candidatus Polarisedimenticolia bacterium]